MRTFASSKTTKMNYRKEHFIYTLMWILIYISPFMGTYMRMSSNPHIEFSWYEVLNAWKFDTVWLVLFAVHNFLLAPLLILKRRTILYVILIFTVIGVAMGILWFLRPAYHHHRLPRYSRHERVLYRDNIPDFRPDDDPEDMLEEAPKEQRNAQRFLDATRICAHTSLSPSSDQASLWLPLADCCLWA